MEGKRNVQWKQIPPRRRRRMAGMALLELVFTSMALWDLAHRPASQIKGKKPLWVAFSFVQPIGPISYLLFGRKK